MPFSEILVLMLFHIDKETDEAVTFLLFHCYPDREVQCHYFFIFLNVNINLLPDDCDTDAQRVQVELNGRHLFCSTLPLLIKSQLPLIRTRIQSFSQIAVCGFAYTAVLCTFWGTLRSSPQMFS